MNVEKKRLNLLLPKELLNIYAKLCIDLGISQTQGITQFLLCVKRHNEECGENNSPMLICFNLGKQEEKK